MEQAIMQLRRRWALLRSIAGALVEAAFLVLASAIPLEWWVFSASALVVGSSVTVLALVQRKIVWAWCTFIVESALFLVGLLSAIFSSTGEAYVPLLLLGFLLMLISEHVLRLMLSYGLQFSSDGNRLVTEFNADSLRASLTHLYTRLAWDGLLFGTAFLMTVAIATVGEISPKVGILSDPSVFGIMALMSLALLVMLKQE